MTMGHEGGVCQVRNVIGAHPAGHALDRLPLLIGNTVAAAPARDSRDAGDAVLSGADPWPVATV